MIHIKRIYDQPEAADGYRILVDRLWPRGVNKAQASLDLWFKEVAPSAELRQWFDHDPAKFGEFTHRYQAELASNPAFTQLEQIVAAHENVSLLYGAKSQTVNHARVLAELLEHDRGK